jgi:hypothetical protein
VPIELPSYRGVYKRRFLPPTAMIGVGRWGTDVLAKFFEYLDSSFTVDSKHLFCRLAFFRALDERSISSNWAQLNVVWDASLDTLKHDKFRFDVPERDALFWGCPRHEFTALLPGILTGHLEEIRRLAGAVSTTNWQKACQDVGVRHPVDFASCSRWVVIAGSLHEPEVASLLAQLITTFQSEVLTQYSYNTRFLLLLDAGIPDEPGHKGYIWHDIPDALAAQSCVAINQFKPDFPAVAYYFSTPNAREVQVTADTRTAAAAALLRGYFISTLLSPNPTGADTQQLNRRNALTLASNPQGIRADRAAVFLEVSLQLSNLETLVTTLALARWEMIRFTPAVDLISFETLTQLVHGVSSTGKEGARSVITEWTNKWFCGGIHPGQAEQLRLLSAWIVEQRRLRGEAFAVADSDPSPPERPVRKWYSWLLRTPDPMIEIAARAAERDLRLARYRDETNFYDELSRLVDRLVQLDEFVSSAYSPFEDRTGDWHFDEREYDEWTLILKYRRMPNYKDCPAFIQRLVDGLSVKIDQAIIDLALDAGALAVSLDGLVLNLSDSVGKELANLADINDRWKKIGLTQWVRSDPQLQRRIAQFITRRMVPLFSPLLERHWPGDLTLFDFRLVQDSDQFDDTKQAWELVLNSFPDVADDPDLLRIGSARSVYTAALASSRIANESWPALYGWGLLWSEVSGSGGAFRNCWGHETLRNKGRRALNGDETIANLISLNGCSEIAEEEATDVFGIG